jgi:hypothetical protein
LIVAAGGDSQERDEDETGRAQHAQTIEEAF